MSNNDGHTKTLRFSDALDEKFGKVAQKLRRSKLQLFGLMVDYFHKTGKDPADISDEVLKTTLVKNHDTYTGSINNWYVPHADDEHLCRVFDDFHRIFKFISRAEK